jgi:hypothetical protein
LIEFDPSHDIDLPPHPYVVKEATTGTDTSTFNDTTVEIFKTAPTISASPASGSLDLTHVALAIGGKLALTINGQTVTYINGTGDDLAGAALADVMRADTDFNTALGTQDWNLASTDPGSPAALGIIAATPGQQDLFLEAVYTSGASSIPIVLEETINGSQAATGALTVTTNGLDVQYITLGHIVLAPGGTLVGGGATIFTNESQLTLSGPGLVEALQSHLDLSNLPGWAQGEIGWLGTNDFLLELIDTTSSSASELPASYASHLVAEQQTLVFDQRWALDPGATLSLTYNASAREFINSTDNPLQGYALAREIANLAEAEGWSVEIRANNYGNGVEKMIFTAPAASAGTDVSLLDIKYSTGTVTDKSIEMTSRYSGSDAAATLSSLANMDAIDGFTIGQDKIWLPDPTTLGWSLAHGALASVDQEGFDAAVANMVVDWYRAGLFSSESDSYLLVHENRNTSTFDPDNDIVIKLTGVTSQEAANAVITQDLFTNVIL